MVAKKRSSLLAGVTKAASSSGAAKPKAKAKAKAVKQRQRRGRAQKLVNNGDGEKEQLDAVEAHRQLQLEGCEQEPARQTGERDPAGRTGSGGHRLRHRR